MFRVALLPEPHLSIPAFLRRWPGRESGMVWRVAECWRVNDAWATRAVNIDRRGPKHLQILTPRPMRRGSGADPLEILKGYLATLPVEVKARRGAELREGEGGSG